MLGPWFKAIIHVMLGQTLAGTLGQHRGTPHGGLMPEPGVNTAVCRAGALQCSADNVLKRPGG